MTASSLNSFAAIAGSVDGDITLNTSTIIVSSGST